MSRKKVHHEEHVDETWLIPYADMLTLLLALFIVMFAMSKVDSEKFGKVSEEFNVIFQGGQGVLKDPKMIPPPIEVPESLKGEGAIEDDKMHDIKEMLEIEIESAGYADIINVELSEKGLEIAMQDVALFKSGDSKVVSEVAPLLIKISSMLFDIDNSIKIAGHTDNIAISTSRYQSNWDLSAMRAINVMNFMVEKGGLLPERFTIQAYSEYSPKYDNSTEEGRARNRRVEIYIDRKYIQDERKTDLEE